MELSALRIVFMGTPEFAVASLQALLEAGYKVVAVITAPDKAAGRGMLPQQTAVKKYALEKGLPILQPEKLKDPDFLETLRSYHADLQVVVAFRMLPEAVWDMPPMGTINLHGSVLPQYRGAAPINWAIINGEKETGVTSFKLQHEIDTGNILLTEKIPIGENETAGELHNKMKIVGAKLLVRTIEGIANNSLEAVAQSSDHATLKTAPKLFTETCIINWNKPVDEVHDLVRGLSPYPAAFTYLDEKKLKVFAGVKEKTTDHYDAGHCGKYFTDHKSFLKFGCADGYYSISNLQLEGKKRMAVEDFLRGYRFKTD